MCAIVSGVIDRALQGFGGWFASRQGVVQTTAAVALWLVAWAIDPGLDAHLFWLLVVLTIYSGVTQNALANQNREALDSLMRVEKHIETMLEHLMGAGDDGQ